MYAYILAAIVLPSASSEELPKWDLEGVFGFSGINDSRIPSHVDATKDMAESFYRRFSENVSSHPVQAIESWDHIQTRVGRVEHYLSLLSMVYTLSNEESQHEYKLQKSLGDISDSYLGFLADELMDMNWTEARKNYDEDDRMKLAWKFYSPYIKRMQSNRPHRLSADVNRALGLRNEWVNHQAASALYSSVLSSATIDWENPRTHKRSSKSVTELTQCLSDSDWRVRSSCLQAKEKLLRERVAPLSVVTMNEVSGDYIASSMQYNFYGENNKDIRAKRNFQNQLSSSAVNTMLDAIRAKSQNITSRFYGLKRRVLMKTDSTMTSFDWSDRKAPTKLASKPKHYDWSEGVALVEKAFQEFDESQGKDNFQYASLFKDMIEEKRYQVDAAAVGSGSFADPTNCDVGPMISLSWIGRLVDVFVLAHESGHGIHFIRSSSLGKAYCNPPLTLAEVASLFCEGLIAQHLLDEKVEGDSDEHSHRFEILMTKLDRLMNTLVRQAFFDHFEKSLYDYRLNSGLLEVDTVVEAWRESLKIYFGEAFDNYNGSFYSWASIAHFHEVPFYVYAYSFSQLMAGFVFSKRTDSTFHRTWSHFLNLGSAYSAAELFSDIGAHLESTEFWEDALDRTIGIPLAEAELLAEEIGI